MEQQTGPKLGKEYIKAIYCHPAFLAHMQSTSCEVRLDEAQAGVKIAREISVTSDMQITPSFSFF